MSFNVISFLKSALANRGAVPVADDNPLPVGQYLGGSAVGPANPLPVAGGTDYETVAESQTDRVLGATGAIGDKLDILWIVPATTSPGAVSIKDGAGSAIVVFTGGAASVLDLRPQPVVLGIKCTGAGWKVTTGANVSVIGTGEFT
jgi:hypothetical protein